MKSHKVASVSLVKWLLSNFSDYINNVEASNKILERIKKNDALKLELKNKNKSDNLHVKAAKENKGEDKIDFFMDDIVDVEGEKMEEPLVELPPPPIPDKKKGVLHRLKGWRMKPLSKSKAEKGAGDKFKLDKSAEEFERLGNAAQSNKEQLVAEEKKDVVKKPKVVDRKKGFKLFGNRKDKLSDIGSKFEVERREWLVEQRNKELKRLKSMEEKGNTRKSAIEKKVLEKESKRLEIEEAKKIRAAIAEVTRPNRRLVRKIKDMAIDVNIKGFFKKKEKIEGVLLKEGASKKVISSGEPVKGDVKLSEVKRPQKLSEVNFIKRRIYDGRDALADLDFKLARHIYVEVMDSYNLLKDGDKAKVYEDIKELYDDRKRAESMFAK